MSTSRRLAETLSLLSRSVGQPDGDLFGTLDALTQAAGAAVPSFLGFRVTVGIFSPPLEFTWGPTLAPGPGVPIPAGTSLLFRLPLGRGSQPGVNIVLYATRPGAFVDLAADLRWLTRDDGGLVLDRHHVGAVTAVYTDHVMAASTIDQAVGALIEGGLTPHEADAALDASAAGEAPDRLAAAHQVLADLAAPASSEDESH